jgi:hypothetical protein
MLSPRDTNADGVHVLLRLLVVARLLLLEDERLRASKTVVRFANEVGVGDGLTAHLRRGEKEREEVDQLRAGIH